MKKLFWIVGISLGIVACSGKSTSSTEGISDRGGESEELVAYAPKKPTINLDEMILQLQKLKNEGNQKYTLQKLTIPSSCAGLAEQYEQAPRAVTNGREGNSKRCYMPKLCWAAEAFNATVAQSGDDFKSAPPKEFEAISAGLTALLQECGVESSSSSPASDGSPALDPQGM